MEDTIVDLPLPLALAGAAVIGRPKKSVGGYKHRQKGLNHALMQHTLSATSISGWVR
jgi:hypothetical protein